MLCCVERWIVVELSSGIFLVVSMTCMLVIAGILLWSLSAYHSDCESVMDSAAMFHADFHLPMVIGYIVQCGLWARAVNIDTFDQWQL